MAATTDQQARMFSLLIGVGELVRDGNRDAEDVLKILQIIKEERTFANILLGAHQQGESQELVIPAYPAVGEIFELTLDGDALEHQPLEMVRRDGYSGEWKHSGPVVQGKQTRRFKFVQIGYCRTFEEVRRRIAKHGSIPEGQWREAFRAAFPKPDGDGPVGIADSSWVSPYGGADFPYVGTDGDSYFYWAGHDFDEDWRWLVEVSK